MIESIMHALILDCLTAGDGQRIFSRDFIGIGPRIVAGFIEEISNHTISTTVIRGEDLLIPQKQSHFNASRYYWGVSG